MKKKISGSLAVFAAVAVAAFNIHVNMNDDNSLSALSLANVEALADGEGGTCIESCLGLWGSCTTSTGATSKAPLVCVTP